MSSELQKIDHSALKVSQVTIVLLNILAFILNAPWLALVVTIFMLVGVILKFPAFGFIYRYILKPSGMIKPEILADYPEPHRFAQGLGGIFMLLGSLALFNSAAVLGWVLVWIVAALAALNAFGGFCVGCFIYYWFGKLSLPGFRSSPPPDTFPGRRPKGMQPHA
jgi:hypothetical protein